MDEQTTAAPPKPDLAGAPSFIETQWPVSKLSKESYKERKAGAGQTLTGLGKWWGRKPLVLVRAIILGLLLPVTDNPTADREAFLALMTMDDDGMWRRRSSIPVQVLVEHCTPREREEYFTTTPRLAWRREIDREARMHLTRRGFSRMNYDERLNYCLRPEEIDGPGPEAWERINAHLGTHATNLPEFVVEMGVRRFGAVPRVGDVFSGGGSIPFEAARLGCEAYGSDLNPVAALLTWGALHIVGGGATAVARVAEAQRRIFDAVQQQVDAWGIERNEEGWIADAYLYCNEVVDPATGWRVPLAPSWIIATNPRVIARLRPDAERHAFDIQVLQGVSEDELDAAKAEGTWSDGVKSPIDRDGNWLPPEERQTTSVDRLRGANGLRLWENDDIVPRPEDVFQERLYCIRCVDPETKQRHYRAPTAADLDREQRVLELVRKRFRAWQATGVLPSMKIEHGYNTDQPIRERGWTHWHHLFNPRQLLLAGLFAELGAKEDPFVAKAMLLLIGRLINWNSRLCIWDTTKSPGSGFSILTFYNQALNALSNYATRPLSGLETTYLAAMNASKVNDDHQVELIDALKIAWMADVWITDPGYGDVIHYDELSEYFLAWYDKQLVKLFPGWYSDSKRALAVKGEGPEFRVTLAECYRRTTQFMRDDGFQVVMFTHQDPEVWADLTLVLWAAGLQVSAAWTVATETSGAGIRQGNYVQGTVILVLRKRQGAEHGDLVDIFPDVQREVREQVRNMQALDDQDDPNFGDTDYQLAAYAAALRVLTAYQSIGEIDVERELRRPRVRGKPSPVVGLIERAVHIASDELIPAGLEAPLWRKLGPEERLYVKGIAVEARGDNREGVYQELARGYSAADYRSMLASRTANHVRMKTPTEFGTRDLQAVGAGSGFAGSLLRQILYAVSLVVRDPEHGPRQARTYLHQELPDYWGMRATIIGLLRYLQAVPAGLVHWQADTKAAQLLLGSIENDAM
jgi:adenine-specific DNA methylase